MNPSDNQRLTVDEAIALSPETVELIRDESTINWESLCGLQCNTCYRNYYCAGYPTVQQIREGKFK